MRECHQPGSIPGGVAEGVVHAFQCGEPMTNPMLSTIWARELSRAAQYTAPGYPPIRGLPALREATCDYLEIGRASCRARGVQYVSHLVVAGSLNKKNHK